MRVYRGKAQSFSEYVIVLALVSSVFVAMQIYVRRGLQGRLKQASDFVVDTARSDLTPAERARYKRPVNDWDGYPVYGGSIFEPVYWASVVNGKATLSESHGSKRMLPGGRTRVEYYHPETKDPGDITISYANHTVLYPY